MNREEIKRQLEKSFIEYVSAINNVLESEKEKTIRFNFLTNYTKFLAKQFDIELEV